MTAAATTYETPEFELASQGRRLGAFVLDALLGVVTLGIGWLIWFLVIARRGQTPAKQILGLHIVRADGTAAGFWWTVLREIVLKVGAFALLDFVLGRADGTIAGYITLAVFVVAALWCVWDTYRQCLWDKVARTWVVHLPQQPVALMPTSPGDTAAQNLETLEDLHSRGLLTDEEYEERRARELDQL